MMEHPFGEQGAASAHNPNQALGHMIKVGPSYTRVNSEIVDTLLGLILKA